MAFFKETKSKKWQVQPIGQQAGTAPKGGSIKDAFKLKPGLTIDQLLFQFKNIQTNESALFSFSGFGIGLGYISFSGVGGWQGFKTEAPMSFYDLDGAVGRVTSAGAGIGGGYGVSYISAFKFSDRFFDSLELKGWQAGTGVSASTVSGIWQMID